ncbi:cytochrome c oxidase subunit 3 [Pseudomonas nitroreducens]|uniref:cytochrome c oxidase subunit 3 n=1 Tax=Pseudomonas nitroreducens TaxID=46680 RepID=UPI00265AA26F|nr:cytochrome c oxidase subunit 3 [Pseudomonas nitroreducens]MCP1648296.1 nitric oxide reductase NorE protein [Pseudomonas nitroreducens]MCP1686871.1 nitric oxide reductase NorE protein [Pseudomonas nitroreducens]
MSTSPEAISARRLPGDLAMWLFILAELTVFAILIIVFAVAQQLNAEGFRAGRAQLDLSTALALTLTLLTAGFCAALAVEQVRRGRQRIAAALLGSAVLLGLAHVVLKSAEYHHLASRGLDLEFSTFFTLFWLITGFHFLHVLLGLVILAWMTLRCQRRAYRREALGGLESGALYWHMVDLVWVVLFPLVYVLAPGS